MAIKIGDTVVIGHPSEAVLAHCSECQKEDELRPYGRNGAWVCFDCAMKDEPETRRQFKKLFE